MKNLINSILVIFTLFGTMMVGLAAMAAPATSNVSLNVRTGPGTSFRVVDTLYPGERVEVKECVSNGWCRIEHVGPDGWVSARYLTPVTSGSGASSAPISSSDPDCSFGINIGPGGPSFSLQCGDAPPPSSPSPPPAPPAPEVDEVCFYKGNNYTGARACMTPDLVRPNMSSSWDNAVSSITVSGDAKVKLCQGTNFTGLCQIYSGDVAVLPSSLNNKISSYEVFTGSPTPPPPPPVATEACFFKGNNYTGSRICVPEGTNRPTLPASWNNSISSFTVSGGAKVKICQGANFTGLCQTYSSNRAVLNGNFNNKVSSYMVFTGAPPSIPVVPVTHSTGPLNIPQTYMADLDTGAVTTSGADIWYQAVTAVNKFITPRNGAKLSVSGPAQRGYAGCSSASYSANKISIWALPVGTYVCVKTNEGRISEFRLNGYTGTTMNLGYTTWAN